MGIKIKGGSGPDSDINVTPLIDIVLVMLIIFMVMTPMKIDEMAVNLPEKTEVVEQDEQKPDQLVVAIYDDGSMALNKRILSMEELARQLRIRLRTAKRRVVFVDAHPDLPYGSVVAVMDMVRNAGADKVGLATLKDEGPLRPGPVDPAAGAGSEQQGGAGS